MFYTLKFLSQFWGPLRLLGSHLILMCVGAVVAVGIVLFFLPRLWGRCPIDRGKDDGVPDGKESKGKPTGAGKWIFLLLLPVLAFVLPLGGMALDATAFDGATLLDTATRPLKWGALFNRQWGIVVCLMLVMWTGYADDSATKPWSSTWP